MAYLELQGTHLFYERQGEGEPPLVFVHGFACDHSDWQAQMGFLRPRQCVVACDLRGHGASAGDPTDCGIETYGTDVSALVRDLDLPPAILIGHSMGCRVVLQAYLDAPQQVAGLVLVDGSHIGTGDLQGAEQAMRQHINTIGYSTMIRGFFADMFLGERDPAVKDRIISRALTLPESIGASLFARIVGWDARAMDAALSRVTVPLLVIQSTYVNSERARVPLSPGARTPWLELVRHHVPTAQIDIISGAGHFTMLDKPQAVNQLLAAFVATVSCSRKIV
jgi:pimeloyl-ACP methyl ester carboxylesterase